jgi:hypothetical protein
MPIALPAAAMLALFGWKLAVSDPGDRVERAGRQPLLRLEKEVAMLRLSCPDREARDLRSRAVEAAKSLMKGPQDANSVLGSLQKSASEQGWEATFQASKALTGAGGNGSSVGYLPAKGKLQPAAGNQRPWETLLPLLDRVSAPEQPIDLTRLAIRADEEGRISVETGLRLAYLFNNEKIAQ